MKIRILSLLTLLLVLFTATTADAQRRRPIIRDSSRFLAQFDGRRFSQAQIDSIRTVVYNAQLVTDYGERLSGFISQVWKFSYPTTARHGGQTIQLNTIIQIANDGKGMSGASGLTPEYEVPTDNSENSSAIGFGCLDSFAINDGTCNRFSYTPKDSLIVAIIDTGLDSIDLKRAPGTPFRDTLSSRILRDGSGNIVGFDCSDTTNVTTDNFPEDLNGHGTHVAGTIAKTIAAYPNAKIRFMIIRALNKNGNGSLLGLQRAVQFAVSNRAKVVNMSLSFVADFAVLAGTPLQTIMENAGRDSNVVFIVAAGNDGINIDTARQYGYFPAEFTMPNLIAVAALDTNCVSSLAPFSNRGAKTVDLAAPGRMIRATELHTSPTAPGFDSYRSGTSMATPQVAATAALAGNFKYTNAGFQYLPILNAIRRSVKTTPVSFPDLNWQGRLNTCGALQIITPTFNLTRVSSLDNIKIYPNPLGDQALNIDWTADQPETVAFQLYNLAGQLIETKAVHLNGGENSINWDIKTPMPSGVYLLKMVRSNGSVAVQKMVKE